MKEKMTSVSIAKTPIAEEVQLLIEALVVMSLEKQVSQTRVIQEVVETRRKYQEAYREINIESEQEIEFRRKALMFFERPDILPIGNLGFNHYQLSCANYHIEAVCAANKLFNDGDKLSLDAIYTVAKDEMRPTDEYMHVIGRKRDYLRSYWHLTSKKDNLKGLRNYFEHLSKDFLSKNETYARLCREFLDKYEYHPSEEVWLKMVYIICNF